MKKTAVSILFSMLMLSGCSLPTVPGVGGDSAGISFLKSVDGGLTFEPKVTINENENFASSEVLTLTFNSQDTRKFYLGTRSDGVFATDDSGDHWKKLSFPPLKAYSIISDISNANRLFATGVWQERGKIYRSDDSGDNWTEVYTEPANGTVITALAQNPSNAQELYAGTSTGVLIRTNDGGQTWKNMMFGSEMNGHIIWSIIFDKQRSGIIYFLTDTEGMFVADGEKMLTEPASIMSSGVTASSSEATSIAVDPSRSGVVYMGTPQGLFRSLDYGKTWISLNIIESSRKFPIRAIAVRPNNPDEIIYVSASALYKSIDGGVRWSTYQIEGSRVASFIKYDTYNPDVVYVGFKNN